MAAIGTDKELSDLLDFSAVRCLKALSLTCFAHHTNHVKAYGIARIQFSRKGALEVLHYV